MQAVTDIYGHTMQAVADIYGHTMQAVADIYGHTMQAVAGIYGHNTPTVAEMLFLHWGYHLRYHPPSVTCFGFNLSKTKRICFI
jgi:hypothetical protein